MNSLWQGNLATRLRIGSGLILFAYAFFHFINIGLGLVSPTWMDAFQDSRQWITRSTIGSVVLYAAFGIHAALAFVKLAGRRTLRMPVWEAVQIILGLMIPALLITHIVHTRAAHEILNVDDQMGYIMVLIHGTWSGLKQSLLLLIVWVHGCAGLHFWLRSLPWWHRWQPALIGCAVLVPAFALAGFLVEGRRLVAAFADEDTQLDMMDDYNWPGPSEFAFLVKTTEWALTVFGAVILLVVGYYLLRKTLARRRAVSVNYIDGPAITAPKGLTLLEMSRANGVPHTALCGGKGRCTTCRVVVEEGLDLLHPPSEAEAKSLAAVGAGPKTRLACQIKPTDPTTVFRVFQDGRKRRAHATQGEEKELAILFLDMRGFTARTTGQLPYDVVFLLNRFFDAVVPAVTRNNGTIDKYMGDGFLAVFETANAHSSAQAALRATMGIAKALASFNVQLNAEGQPPVAIGIGVHLGDVVLGEIGAAGHAPRTLIGDTVNTASRLEAITKEHSAQVFLSQPLLKAAGIDMPASAMIELQLRGVADVLLALRVENAETLDTQLSDFGALQPA
ncbi:Adenylate cyclase 1 [Ascidiaceihabitans donghaensis]|uniref:Adenylate cyclase 1 n=1 Tax=Ascidiaceihabitans donghaensis TaxID=1510460 RepID=A0A2R8BAV0_9RHOB|nr:adenylate/guanylate cyclase domain-containing protein [Ascidiaceihabitans donghaensis]SPH20145.1 Adenylate cyclase 1 [Ascidiaceihabitans donghaensis]